MITLRKKALNEINKSIQQYAQLLLGQGFTFNQLCEDIDEAIRGVTWPNIPCDEGQPVTPAEKKPDNGKFHWCCGHVPSSGK